MKISFFGHADFCEVDIYRKKLENLISNFLKSENVDFYLGGYGRFDSFALNCCKEIKKKMNNVKLVFITPYIGKWLENKNSIIKINYDECVYPPIETIHPKFAILKRNEWIIDNSDFIVFYVSRKYGGAYQALKYAIKKGKKFKNIFEKE